MKIFITLIFILFSFASVSAQQSLSADRLKQMIVDLSRQVEVIREQRDAAIAANEDKAELIKRDNQTIAALELAIAGYKELLAAKDAQIQTRDDLIKAKDETIKKHEEVNTAQAKVIQVEQNKTKNAKREGKACMVGGGIGAGVGGVFGSIPGAIAGSVGGCLAGKLISKIASWF